MAVGDAHVFSWLSHTCINTTFSPKPQPDFLTCFSRGERRKFAGKKFASTGYRTHNHQVMSPTRSPLFHPSGATISLDLSKLQAAADKKTGVAVTSTKNLWTVTKHCSKGENDGYQHFSPFPTIFPITFSNKVVSSRDCVGKG